MDFKKYDDMILSKIAHSLDAVIPIGILVVSLNSIINFVSRGMLFFYINIFVLSLLIILVVFRKQISTEFKITALATIAIVNGILLLYVRGFYGSGVETLFVGIILIVGYRSKKLAIRVIAATITALIVLAVLQYLNILNNVTDSFRNISLVFVWVNHILNLVLSFSLVYSVVNSIKKHFSISLKEVEDHSKQINYLAYYDQLSGLPNKNKLFSKDSVLLDKPGFMVLFSISEFDMINSIYGRQEADEINIAVAEAFINSQQGNNIYAKTGTNELAWLMYNISKEELMERSRRFIDSAKLHKIIIEKKRNISFHIGYYEFDKSSTDIHTAYQKASIALQVAKLSGSLTAINYSEEIESNILESEHIKELIEEGFENREFYMCYQEKTDCRDNKVIGVEALARWQSKELGLVSPKIFIPHVEKSQFNSRFGIHTIDLVLNDYPKLCKKYGDGVEVAINISPQFLSSVGFVEFTVSAVKQRKISPQNIVFEITEEVLIENVNSAISVINELKSHGFKIALDDFGTGYSSLNYLSRLEFDEVKIDKSFIDRITFDNKTLKIIEAIIALKNAYGFKIVAEGVETKEQCDMLFELGCGIIQGYYFSKPSRID